MSSPAETDEARFTEWIREHRGILLKVARAYTTTAVDEADLFQEATFQLWRSLPQFLGQAKASTWIYRVALNTALTWKRSERRRDYLLTPLDATMEPACRAPLPSESHEQAEALAALYAAIRELVPAERALVLLLLDGLSYREIAEISGLTENHVGVALTRARRKLAEAMKEVRHEL